VKNGYYNGQIFHRVVPGKLIQAGDYTSIKNPDKADIGEHDVEHTVDPEIDATKRIHKRGALAAASPGGHFYIVVNKKVKEKEIDAAEKAYTKELVNIRFQEIQKPHLQELTKLRNLGESNNRKKEEYEKKVLELNNQAKKETKDFHYTKEQRKTYLNEGGLPANDANYTVFGEVVEGMDVVDAIATVKTGFADKPVEDVVILGIDITEM
jgi:cyclophilin family peptidyl-prolyl cis-trans isomerase